ncbi:TBC1 domain family, member 13, partial [Reticulomyxa filosa]
MEALKKVVGGKKSQSRQVGSRLDTFQTILNQPHIDLKALRELCFDGIPEEDTALKAKCWKILLEYLPLERSEWRTHLEQQRTMYSFYINLLFQTPDADRIQEKEKKEEMEVNRTTRAATVDENKMEKNEENKAVKPSQSLQRSHSQNRLVGGQVVSQSSSSRQTVEQKQKQKEERLKRQKKTQQKLKALFSDNDDDDLAIQSNRLHAHDSKRTNALWSSDYSDNDNPHHHKESQKDGKKKEKVDTEKDEIENGNGNGNKNKNENENGTNDSDSEIGQTNIETPHGNIDRQMRFDKEEEAMANEKTKTMECQGKLKRDDGKEAAVIRTNPWLSYFEDWKIWNKIEKDIHRTHQSFAFFRSREMIHEKSLSKSYRFPFDRDAIDPDI